MNLGAPECISQVEFWMQTGKKIPLIRFPTHARPRSMLSCLFRCPSQLQLQKIRITCSTSICTHSLFLSDLSGALSKRKVHQPPLGSHLLFTRGADKPRDYVTQTCPPLSFQRFFYTLGENVACYRYLRRFVPIFERPGMRGLGHPAFGGA
jgi:hypothetical protein